MTPDSSASTPPIDKAAKAISDHFSGASLRIKGPVSLRANSEVFFGVVEQQPPVELAIKVCLQAPTQLLDMLGAKEQFEALDNVYRALGKKESRFRVPEPICFIPEAATYAMSWVQGIPLSQKIKMPYALTHGEACFEDVGYWLGMFHKAGPVACLPTSLVERREVVSALSAAGKLPEPAFRKAISALNDKAGKLEGISSCNSWLHGDCKIDNFLFSNDEVYGIDIGLKYCNPVEYDLAQFLNNLDLHLGHPGNLHLAFLRQRFEGAFLRGYGRSGISITGNYLDWLRLNFLLSFWFSTLEEKKLGLRRWMLNRVFSAIASRLTEKLFRIK